MSGTNSDGPVAQGQTQSPMTRFGKVLVALGWAPYADPRHEREAEVEDRL